MRNMVNIADNKIIRRVKNYSNNKMVYNNGFGVKIITDGDQDKLKRESYNYVALQNATEYKLQLTNTRSTDAMAEVYIEGKKVGMWLIPAKDNITIDRPADIARKFTFFKETDKRAISAGVIPGESFNGVIRVVFYPKKQFIAIKNQTQPKVIYSPKTTQGFVSSSTISSPSYVRRASPLSKQINGRSTEAISPRQTRTYGNNLSIMPRPPSYQSGATVLGDHSQQQFGSAKRFEDNEIDWDNKTEIIIRLVVKPDRNLFMSTVKSSSGNIWNNNTWDEEYVAIQDYSESIPPRIENFTR